VFPKGTAEVPEQSEGNDREGPRDAGPPKVSRDDAPTKDSRDAAPTKVLRNEVLTKDNIL